MGAAAGIEVIHDSSMNLPWGGVAAGYQRNELAAVQFNRSEVLGLLDCSF
jgi:hypothetical protein